ncbi:MAG: hypothetical protein IPL65_15480 [Lewinellaceae bacterium]|nr:hypothetical protein [Lewinellaceae bacterium]
MVAQILPPKVRWLHPFCRLYLPGCFLSLLACCVGTYVNAQTCNNNISISLDSTCTLTVSPDMVLEGTYNLSNFVVLLKTTAGIPVPNNLSASNLGQTFIATVLDTTTTNSCWGNIKIVDQLPPKITCFSFDLICAIPNNTPDYLANNLGITAAQPVVSDNCGPTSLQFTDVYNALSCLDPLDRTGVIQRYWTVSDASGNSSSCQQQINIIRVHNADIFFPADYNSSCEAPQTDPVITGVPVVNFAGQNFPLFPGGACDLVISFTEQTLPVCAGAYKILRNWVALDNCPVQPNPVQHIQVVNVSDTNGPVMQCPADTVYTAHPQFCSQSINLPDILLSDNCSDLATFSAHWQVDTIPFFLTGSLSDFPGNNYWNQDTLGVLGWIYNLPIGKHTIYYYAGDDCGKQSTCSFKITVQDDVPPVAACDKFTQVNIGGSGSSLVHASTFDDGSYDNCGITSFKVRRVDPSNCQSENMFYDVLKVCCEDVGDTVDIVLRVYDFLADTGAVSLTYGQPHQNDCAVKVLVKDKLKPACLPPANVTVDCEDFDPSLENYGWPITADNCCMDTTYELSANTSQFDTLCNRGTLVRTFRAVDCYGASNQCTQRVVVNYNQDYWVKFPDDLLINDCDTTGYYSPGPEIFGNDCELISISYNDEYFEAYPAVCVKIERTWKVINWCTYNPNLPFTIVPNPQPTEELNGLQNLTGPTVAPPGNTPSPTVVRISPTDPNPTDFSIFWSAESNGYLYKQIINVRDEVPPKIRSCPLVFPLTFCDQSGNDPQLWNKSY